MRRAVWLVLVGVVLVGAFFLTVSPARTYVGQQRNIAAAERRVEVLAAQNEKLATRVEQLHTDAEIERLAREQYNLVKPGEEAYALLPSAGSTPTATVPPVAEAKPERSLPGKVWHFLTGWM